jgi:hypothetical protein
MSFLQNSLLASGVLLQLKFTVPGKLKDKSDFVLADGLIKHGDIWPSQTFFFL